MSRVLLATSADHPEGEPCADLLDEALRRRGLDSSWAVWDDPGADWAAADLVAVRSTWDYQRRLEEFLGWADRVGPRLLNGSDVFRWNTDKRYLVQLAGTEVPVLPTRAAATVDEVSTAQDEFGVVVAKPAVGASGVGVEVLAPGELPAREGPWVVQPLVESVRTTGESSVFVLDGQAVGQVDKRPADGEIRVHEEYGGSSAPAAVGADQGAVAVTAVAAATALLDADLAYARVDLLHHQGRWVLSELELTEPGLYLDVLPANADAFADLVASRLRSA